MILKKNLIVLLLKIEGKLDDVEKEVCLTVSEERVKKLRTNLNNVGEEIHNTAAKEMPFGHRKLSLPKFPHTGRTLIIQDFYFLTKMDDTFIFLRIYIFTGLIY